MNFHDVIEQHKHLIDALAVSSLIGTMFGYLPDATAALTFVWVAVRLFETDTVQGWFRRK